MAINLEKRKTEKEKVRDEIDELKGQIESIKESGKTKEAKKVEVNRGDVISSGTAILWWLVCYPVGYSQWGQATKGWVSLLLVIFTGGYGGIVVLVDYIKCYNAQKTRELGEWEFFPKS